MPTEIWVTKTPYNFIPNKFLQAVEVNTDVLGPSRSITLKASTTSSDDLDVDMYTVYMKSDLTGVHTCSLSMNNDADSMITGWVGAVDDSLSGYIDIGHNIGTLLGRSFRLKNYPVDFHENSTHILCNYVVNRNIIYNGFANNIVQGGSRYLMIYHGGDFNHPDYVSQYHYNYMPNINDFASDTDTDYTSSDNELKKLEFGPNSELPADWVSGLPSGYTFPGAAPISSSDASLSQLRIKYKNADGSFTPETIYNNPSNTSDIIYYAKDLVSDNITIAYTKHDGATSSRVVTLNPNDIEIIETITAEDGDTTANYTIRVKKTSISGIVVTTDNGDGFNIDNDNNVFTISGDGVISGTNINIELSNPLNFMTVVGSYNPITIGSTMSDTTVTVKGHDDIDVNYTVRTIPISGIRSRIKDKTIAHFASDITIADDDMKAHFSSGYIETLLSTDDISTTDKKRDTMRELTKQTFDQFKTQTDNRKVVFDNDGSKKLLPHINKTKIHVVSGKSDDIPNIRIVDLEEDEGFYALLDNEGDAVTITTLAGGVIKVVKQDSVYNVYHDNNLKGGFEPGDTNVFQHIRYTIGSVSGEPIDDWVPPVFANDALCIMEGQNVLTDKGYTKVENIQIGDCVNGTPVLHITKQMTPHKLIKFSQDCFGKGAPSKDVYLTHDHLVCDPHTKQLNNAIVYTLLNKNVVAVEPPCEAVYNFIFSDWKLLDIDGLRCESISPYTPQTMALGFKPEHEVEVSNASELMVYGDNIVPKVIGMKEESEKSEMTGNTLTV